MPALTAPAFKRLRRVNLPVLELITNAPQSHVPIMRIDGPDATNAVVTLLHLPCHDTRWIRRRPPRSH
jgi:hypothetical protein